MDKKEEILKSIFGGLIGEIKVYITDKDLLLSAMSEYASHITSEKDKRIAELEEAVEQGLSRIDPKSKDTWDLKAILVMKKALLPPAPSVTNKIDEV